MNDINKTACFTGHRRISGEYYTPNSKIWGTVADNLRLTIVTHVMAYHINTFISGGALGVDQLAAEIVIDLKQNDFLAHLKLIIARPFPSQASKWPPIARARFEHILTQTDYVVDVNPDPYASYKMEARNQWMINHSKYVIAVQQVEKGGTANAIAFANKNKKFVSVLRV